MTGRYAWRGGEEMLLRYGDDPSMNLLILPALFEEANRMRRFTVELMRRLASRRMGAILPDLPGTGESLVPLADVTLDHWRDAVASIAATLPKPVLTVAIRGGAVLDDVGDHGWRLAPESGERQVRDLIRATALSGGAKPSALDRRAREAPTALAGNVFSPALYTALHVATPLAANRRVARIENDAGPRDISLPGTKLWRAAEPGEDPSLCDAVADDIAAWAKTCATL